VLGKSGSKVVDLLWRKLSNLEIVDCDVSLVAGNDVERVLELLGRDSIQSDGDHVVSELLERNSVTSLSHTLEDAFENDVSSLEVEFHNTKTRKTSLEIELGELSILLRVEVVERFLELLELFGRNVTGLSSSGDLALDEADLLGVVLLELTQLELEIIVAVVREFVILDVGIVASVLSLLDGVKSRSESLSFSSLLLEEVEL